MTALETARGLLIEPHLCREDDERLGGKGRNLQRLDRHGLPVPAFTCVSVEAHALLVERLCDTGVLADTLANLDFTSKGCVEAAAQELVRSVLELELPPELEVLLDEVVPAALRGDRLYAVRSSAAQEDSADASFAGQLDSQLCVALVEVSDSVRRCWASAYTPRMLHYLHALGRDPLATRVAVVIQEMVESDASGVLFTLDPSSRRDACVIVAGLGLGEGVVEDHVETDTFVVERTSGELEAKVRRKTQRIVRNIGGGTKLERVPQERCDEPALDPARVHQLIEFGLRIETIFEAPQDVEWALDAAGSLYITQARPITALPAAERCVLDNSNIAESYPGVTSPLTFSFVSGLYETIFRSALRRMGVSRQTLAKNAHVFRNLAGTLDGRVYYILSNWYPMLRLLPAADWLVPAWEEAAGVAERTGSPAEPPPRGVRALREGAAVAARMLREWITLDHSMRSLKRAFATTRRAFAEHDLEKLDNHSLARLHETLAADLLDGWEVTILNDFMAIGFSSWSKGLLESFGATDSWNGLLCGEPGMESVEPVHSLVQLAETVRARPELARRLRAIAAASTPVDASLAMLADDRDLAEFRRRFEEHVERYGDRCIEELKLETSTFRTDPRGLVELVLRQAATDLSVATMERRERAIRNEAERNVAGALRGHPAKRALLKFVLAQARRSIMHREASRLDRARAFGIPRAILRQIGRNLARDAVLREPDDVFQLTVPEALGYIRGASVDPNLADIALRRQALQAEQRKRKPPARVVCRGSVYRSEPPQRRAAEPVMEGEEVLLQGVPCSPGVVTGEAVVVRDPASVGDVSGQILVAESTDPGWVFLMTTAAGLIVENGSILSHTAIIGRELGIVTVVGVPQATERIPSGARVRLDGRSGTVALLPNPSESE